MLSFGADEDEGEEASVKKKAIFRPDRKYREVIAVGHVFIQCYFRRPVVQDERLSAAVPDFVSKPNAAAEPKKDAKVEKSTSRDKDKDDITRIREIHAQEQASEE